MSWVSIDDGAPDHRKFLRLAEEERDRGAAAVTLWWAALCYANRQKARDGFIPSAKVVALWPLPLKVARDAAAALVRVELWETIDGGYRVHDYAEYQLTADEVEARREARREAGKIGGQRSGEARRAKQTRSKLLPTTEANAKQVASANEAGCFDSGEANANPLPLPLPLPDHNNNNARPWSAEWCLCEIRVAADDDPALDGTDPEAVDRTFVALARKLSALDPENRFADLRAEVAGWLIHARNKSLEAKGRGQPWDPERVLGEVESKALQRIRFRPSDAKRERDRARAERPVPGTGGTLGGDDSAWELLRKPANGDGS